MRHRLLDRHLKKLGISDDTIPSFKAWQKLLDTVDRTYRQADEDRYLLERSLALTSEEMQALYTDLKQASDTRIAAERDRLKAVLDNVADGIITADENEIIDTFNPAAEKIFGYSADEVIGQQFNKLIADLSFEHIKLKENGTHLLRSILDVESELFGLCKNEEKFPMELSVSEMKLGDRLLFIAIVRDISERKQAEARLKYLSNHDPLTGLYNRAYFEEELNRLEGGRSYPVSVVMTDLDGLKSINDSLGHSAGDDLLRRTADVLKRAFRSEDVVARIGGDEFAVLIPGADTSVAKIALDRVRQEINTHNKQNGNPFISLSLGAATAEPGCGMTTTLKEADQQMYLDKQNRVNNRID